MRAVAVVLAVVAVVAFVWIAGEVHYQSCIAHAEATTPNVARLQSNPGNRAQARPNEAREHAVDGCSRLPF